MTTIGALDGGTANANGATISSTTMYLQSASGSFAGLVNTGTQTFAGDKTFSGTVTVSNGLVAQMGANLSGGTVIQGSSDGFTSLYLTTTPTSSATHSLIQIGSPIVSGNALTNGGTYIGLNTPASGAGSMADLINMQSAGNPMFQVNYEGDAYLNGGLTVSDWPGTGTLLNSVTNVLAASAGGAALLVNNSIGTSLKVQGWGGQNAYPTVIIQNDNSGQTGDLLQLKDGGGIVAARFNLNGNQLTLGAMAASGTVYQGKLSFADGTTDNRSVTLQSSTLTGSYSLSLPGIGVAGSQCLQSTSGSTTSATTLQWGSCGGSSGANTSLSNLASTAVNADIVPDTDNTWMLGTSSLRWKDVYVGPGSLHVGTNGNEGSISYDTANQKLLFSANGTTGLSVASNGNVGFGTATPSTALEVRQGNPVNMTLTAATNPSNTTAFGGINFQSFDTQTSPWSVAYDSTLDTNSPSWSEADAIVLDPVNNILYASGNSSGVYRCDVASTSCDATADWVKVSTASATNFIFDATNNTIYGSSQYGTSLVTCAISTACDASGDWHAYTAVSAGYFNLQAVDGANHKLYASHYDSSPTYLYHMYVCDLTTACDATTDWTQYDLDSTDTSLQPKSMVVDSTNGIVDVSAENMDGYMYRCAASSGCDATTDWTKISTFDNFNGGFTNMQYDSATQSIYAGDTYGEIFRCAFNTACDSGSEWAYVTAFPNSAASTGFSYSSVTGLLYAINQGGGTNANGAASQVMSCAVTSNCDASADWSVQYTYPDIVKNMGLAVDNSGAVYAAGGEGSSPYKALIYRNGGSYVPQITSYGQIGVVAVNSNNTQESGALAFSTINNGTVAEGMRLQGGQLGIGTTSPGYKLDVQDNQASSYVMRVKNTSTANTADGLLIDLGVANASRGTGNYFIGFAGAGTVAGKIQGGASAVAYTTSAADYAEYFRADENNLPQPGELVMLSTDDTQAVTRTGAAGDFIAGVVSTNPGFVGNAPICKVDDTNCDSDYAKYNVLVSMVGQVPVKVSMEGGAIKPGDPIGASSEPGIGMKITDPGTPMIGYAMAATTQDGAITVLVRPGTYMPTARRIVQGGKIVNALTINGAIVSDSINIGGMADVGELNVAGSATIGGNLSVGGGLMVNGLTRLAELLVAGHLLSQSAIPQAASGLAAGQDGTVSIDGTDTAGTITVTIKAHQQESSAEILAAGDLAKVTFAKSYEFTPRVVITPDNPDSVQLPVYIEKAKDGYRLVTSVPAKDGATYQFDYIVMGSEGNP